MREELMRLALLYLLVVNLIGFLTMWADKRRARKGQWRISEKNLFLPALLGGAPGSILGMRIFRHKTKHWYFKFGMPGILLCHLIFAGWLLWRFGT